MWVMNIKHSCLHDMSNGSVLPSYATGKVSNRFLSKQGRIQDFHWGGATGPEGAVFAGRRGAIFARGRRYGRKGDFSCQKGASTGGSCSGFA